MSDIIPSVDGGGKFNDFSNFVNSFDGKFEPVTGCKMCGMDANKRVAAEEKFERGQSIAAIHRWLREEHKEEIGYHSVKNHLTHHYSREDDRMTMREFSGKLKTWSKLNKDDVHFFNRYIDFLDMEAMELAAKNKELPLPERRKNNELIIKIGSLLSTYKEQVHKLSVEMRPVEVIIKSLNRIIQVKLEGTPNPEVKRVLTDIIDQLLREVGDVEIAQSEQE